MKLSLNWLKRYINLTENKIEVIKDKLDEIGFEIENIEISDINNKKFVIAKIVSRKSHPNAEKLSLCEVWDGKESREIVCGAGNVRSDLITVLAKEGAIIPKNGMEIKKNKIRGINSCGMLCSEEELNLPVTDSDGIIDLNEDKYKDKIGSCFYEGEDDDNIVFDVNITPNRGDVLSIIGIGRELITAGFAKNLNLLPSVSIPNEEGSIKINKDICPFYGYIVIKNIDNTIELPKYIIKSLESIGQKSISPVIDIINYMMFTYGQPMHAFDLDKLGNIDISVTTIDNYEEKISGLDDNIYTLEHSDIVVKNNDKIIALAGIIGNSDTACTTNTKNILLEGAIFSNANIAMTARRLKLSTESSYRFERLIDNNRVYDILHHTAETIVNICSGDIDNAVSSGNVLQNKKEIDLNINFISKYLGVNLSENEILNILTKSYYEFEKQDNDSLKIKVPYWRNDIENKENIVADILRIYGIHNIASYPARTDNFLPNIEINWRDKLRQILSSKGYNEIISWSFMNHDKNIKKNSAIVELKTKTIDGMYGMRNSLIPNIINIIKQNKRRGIESFSLFEIGNQYLTVDKAEEILLGIRAGYNCERNIYNIQRKYDIFDIKNDVLALFDDLPIKIENGNAPDYYHPKKSARILLGYSIIGYLGSISPHIDKEINPEIFEIFLDKIPKNTKKPKNPEISVYQEVKRDFAFIFKEEIIASDLIDIVKKITGKLLTYINIFDIYKFKDNKEYSIAFAIRLQALDRTLTTEEINSISDSIIEEISSKLKGVLRLV